MAYDLNRRLAAESLGTAFLLATVVGSGIMASRMAGGGAMFDAYGTEAIALLGNTVATGAILYVLITILGPISGAHFNPAVTLAFTLRGDLSGRESVLYILAQIVGGVLGMLAAHLMFAEPAFQVSLNARTGPDQWFSEVVATFGLVFAIFVALRSRPDAVALVVALYITAAYWFTASTSFANPAVTIARSFTDTFSGIRPTDMPLFIGAQLGGALLAFLAARWLLADPALTTEPAE